MKTKVHGLLAINEYYTSYWADYCIAIYEHLNLENYNVGIDVYFIDESHGLRGSTDFIDSEVMIEIAMIDAYTGLGYDFHDLSKTIAHEFIHAAQYASGRLYHEGMIQQGDCIASSWLWEGKRFVNTPYQERPWETEASNTDQLLMNNVLYTMRM